MQVYLWLLSHTHLGYSDCPTIPCRPIHVSCMTKRRSFRSLTYYGLHDIVLSYMGLSHIHMHMRIHACRLSVHPNLRPWDLRRGIGSAVVRNVTSKYEGQTECGLRGEFHLKLVGCARVAIPGLEHLRDLLRTKRLPQSRN